MRKLWPPACKKPLAIPYIQHSRLAIKLYEIPMLLHLYNQIYCVAVYLQYKITVVWLLEVKSISANQDDCIQRGISMWNLNAVYRWSKGNTIYVMLAAAPTLGDGRPKSTGFFDSASHQLTLWEFNRIQLQSGSPVWLPIWVKGPRHSSNRTAWYQSFEFKSKFEISILSFLWL